MYKEAKALKDNIEILVDLTQCEIEEEKRKKISKVVLKYFGPHYKEKEDITFFSYMGEEKVLMENIRSEKEAYIDLKTFIEDHISYVNLYIPSTSLLMELLERDLQS